MEMAKCPGQDTRYWKPGDIFTAECPKCGAEIEFFKDDTRRRCAWCGHLFYNPKIELGCAEWCQYAEKCVPELVQEKKAAQNFKERLGERVQALVSPEAGERTAKAMAYAQDLLKAEGGDPKVVFAAVLLREVERGRAREILGEMETEAEIINGIMELLEGQAAAGALDRQIFEDVGALMTRPGDPEPSWHTRTAQRLAQEGK